MTSASTQRTELGHHLAGRRVDHLEADDFGRLQVGAALDARELRVADRGENDAEERLADAGHAAQEQVAGVDLPLLLLVVRRRDLRHQHDVGEGLGRVVADERFPAFGDDRLVETDGLFEVWMHWGVTSYLIEYRAMNKVLASAEEAVALIPDGATIMMGGFGLCGIPENLIAALRARGTKDLTVISNNAGVDDFGIGVLLRSRQVRKMISTYVGENKEFERQFLSGELDVELVPQGTFAERIRAGGAGIGGFFTPTGYGTLVAEGKETRTIDGKPHVLETAAARRFRVRQGVGGGPHGNLVYRRTARNFNPVMATAADVTIAEVEQLVEPGEIDPDHVVTPGIFVRHILQGQRYEKRIEKTDRHGMNSAHEDTKTRRHEDVFCRVFVTFVASMPRERL